MRKYPIFVFSIFVFLAGAGTLPAVAADNDSEPIVIGGHGNITVEGPTGLFLNPTSGILAEGELIIQYCAAILEDGENNNFIGHNAILSYGVTDWLELGAFGVSVDRSKVGSGGGGGATPCGPGAGGPGPGPGAGAPAPPTIWMRADRLRGSSWSKKRQVPLNSPWAVFRSTGRMNSPSTRCLSPPQKAPASPTTNSCAVPNCMSAPVISGRR